MSDFDALMAAMIDAPLDAAPRLILADWCDEHGEDVLAIGLRAGRAVLNSELMRARQKRSNKKLVQRLRQHGTNVLQQGIRKMSLTYTDGGIYKGHIVKWGISEAKSKTPQIFFMVMIEKEVDGKGEEFDCPSYERTVFRALTENTVDWVVEELAKLGFTGTSFNQLDPSHPQAHSFDGVEVRLRCKHDEFEGKTREKFEFDFGRKTPDQIDKAGMSKLDALFGNKLKMATSSTKPKAAMQSVNVEASTHDLTEVL